MAQINEVAKQFVDYYYSTFDRNRAELAPLYVSQCPQLCRAVFAKDDCSSKVYQYIEAKFNALI